MSELYKVTAGRIQLSTIETWTFHSVENQYGVLSELSAWAVTACSERFIGWDEWKKTGIGWRDRTHIVLAKGGPKLLR